MPTVIEPVVQSGRFIPSEDGLRMALSAAQAGIWEWHLDTDQNFWSDEIWRLYGLDPTRFPPSFESWAHSLHPDDCQGARQAVEVAAQGRIPFEIEWRTNPSIGPVRWLLSRGQPGKPQSNGHPTYTGIVMDITARKQAEHAAIKLNETLEQRVIERTAALSEHERLQHHILDSVPGLVGYWTKGLINRFANKAYGEWFGFTPDQIRGRHIKELLGPELFDLNWPYMREALAGRTQRFERRLAVPGHLGELRHSEAHYLPDVVDGEVQGFLVMVFDITHVKQAELAAEAASHAKSEFLANISHEVRTPLNAMFGLAQVGARNAAGTASARTFEQILESAKHLLALVNDVLDFSKIEAGKLTLHKDRVDLGQVLEHLLSLKAIRAQAKGLHLSIVEAPEVPQFFHGDATRLSQILLNLLSNAIKFTERGEVCIRLSFDGRELSIAVTDTGTGISPEQASRLFLPFEQLSRSLRGQHGGTGLGLAITKRLVEMMDGHIVALSEPGRGSTFTVRLPLPQSEQGQFAPLAHVCLIGMREADKGDLRVALKARGCEVMEADELMAGSANACVIVIDAQALSAQTLDLLRHRMECGDQIVVSCLASANVKLPAELQASAHVLAGPLSPMRLLNAVRHGPRRAFTLQGKRLSGLNILAAEDNPINRLVLGEMLEQEGANVTFAFDGGLAIEQVRSKGAAFFDIVLCDIQMPVMDGYQTTAALAQMAPSLPVIGLTAHAFDSAKQQARRVGMVGYVTKPYMLDTLVDEIKRFARKHPAAPADTDCNMTPPSSMTPEPPPQQDLNDWQAMQQYFQAQPQLLDRLIGMLTATLREIEQELNQAMSNRDMAALAKVAHNIKGTALNLHTPELARLAVQTQEQARQIADEALDTAATLATRLQAFMQLAEHHQPASSDVQQTR